MKIAAEYYNNAFYTLDNIELERGQYMLEVKKDRNPRFHKLAFALIGAMFDNQEQYTDREAFRRQLKLMTNSVKDDPLIQQDGSLVYEFKSWEWSEMDQNEFKEIYNKLLVIAEKRFGPAFVNQFERISDG